MYKRQEDDIGVELVALAGANTPSDAVSGLNTTLAGTDNGLCGRVAGSTLPACPNDLLTSTAEDFLRCPALPEWLAAATDLPYVQVHTLTETPEGGRLLPSFFSSHPGTAVGACARVAWGPVEVASVLPLTFSDCEWQEATSDGTVFGVEVAIALNYKDKDHCASVVGRDYDGGFGWLEHATGACDVVVDTENWVEGTPGEGKGTDCMHLVVPGATLYIPIFDCMNKDKNFCPTGLKETPPTNYHIKGYGAFLVTGYKLPAGPLVGSAGADALAECSDEAKGGHCLYGSFEKALIPGAEIDTTPSGEDFGLDALQMVG